MRLWLSIFTLAFALLPAGFSLAETESSDPLLTPADDWSLEAVRLRDGRTLRGLVRSAGRKELEIVEVLRPPGKPMRLAVRPLDAAEVAEVTRLPEDARKTLEDRVHRFRNRAAIEAGRMEDVELVPAERDGVQGQAYEGSWFTLFSAAGDAVTRRAVVRIEQLFRAYRNLAPPRKEPKQPLTILLFGSQSEYREHLRRHRLEIDNPAFYSASRNVIAAGSDTASWARRLAQVQTEHERLRERAEQLAAQLPDERRRLTAELRQAGISRTEIQQELAALQAACERELGALSRRIAEADRRNESLLADLTRQMFQRLSHEAFHAYFHSYVAPEGAPRWLDEGLAQVFESGQLDGDTLRLDAPRRDWLLRLQNDLRSDKPFSLAELFAAEDRPAAALHVEGEHSQRYYLYAWGLTWHLAIDEPRLDAQSLRVLSSSPSSHERALARFEQWIGKPWPEFEAAWRKRMLEL